MSLIPIDEVVFFDVVTHNPTTGAISDADSAPTYDVFEEDTDTPILSAQTTTKRTSKTGNYRGSFTASAANGFEAGKWYSVVVSAVVSSLTGKAVVKNFRCAPAEGSAGVPKVDLSHVNGSAATSASGRPEVNVSHFGGTAGTFASGRPETNTTHIAGSAVSTSTAQLGVNVVNFGGSAGTFASGRPEANTTHIAGAAVSTSTAQVGVNVVNYGGSAGTFASGRPEVNVSHYGGTAGTFASGRPEVNTARWAGTATTLSGGVPDVNMKTITAGIIAAASFASGAFDAVWTVATRLLTAGTNIVLAKGVGLTGLNDLSAAQVNAEADTALSDVGLTSTVTGRIDQAISTVLTSALTESYAAQGATMTVAQALYLIQQRLGEFAISGTTLTVKKKDGSTTAATFTLDDATSPTSITRTT